MSLPSHVVVLPHTHTVRGGVHSAVSEGDSEMVYIQQYVWETLRWCTFSNKWWGICGRGMFSSKCETGFLILSEQHEQKLFKQRVLKGMFGYRRNAGENCITRSFIHFSFHQIQWDGWDMLHAWEMANPHTVLVDVLQEGNCLQDSAQVGHNVNISKMYDGRLWTGFIWLSRGLPSVNGAFCFL